MISEFVQRLRRRRHQRVKLEATCELEIPDWHGSEGRAIDVSPGGICMRLPDSVSVGDNLIFSVVQPDGEAFEINAEVRFVKEMPEGDYLVGLRWQAAEADGHRAYQAVLGDTYVPDVSAA